MQAQRKQDDQNRTQKDEQDIWFKYNRELCLYIEFMRAAFNINIYPVNATGHDATHNKPATNILDTHGNFLETQITDVKAFDENNNELNPLSENPTQFSKTPKRVVAYLEYVQMEYIAGSPEKFEARGFKYDYNDPAQMALGIRERASAAYSLVYAAKAQGWTKIDFGKTTDPIERYLLKKACIQVGLSCGNENVYSSIHSDVTVTLPPLNSALFDKKSFTKFNDDAADQMETSIQMQIDNFLANKTAPTEDGGPTPSPSPSMKNKYKYDDGANGGRRSSNEHAKAAFG